MYGPYASSNNTDPQLDHFSSNRAACENASPPTVASPISLIRSGKKMQPRRPLHGAFATLWRHVGHPVRREPFRYKMVTAGDRRQWAKSNR